jgi:hypothetical protein
MSPNADQRDCLPRKRHGALRSRAARARFETGEFSSAVVGRWQNMTVFGDRRMRANHRAGPRDDSQASLARKTEALGQSGCFSSTARSLILAASQSFTGHRPAVRCTSVFPSADHANRVIAPSCAKRASSSGFVVSFASALTS